MLYRETDEEFIEWNGELINDVRYPMNIESVWSAADLASIGLYIPEDPACLMARLLSVRL